MEREGKAKQKKRKAKERQKKGQERKAKVRHRKAKTSKRKERTRERKGRTGTGRKRKGKKKGRRRPGRQRSTFLIFISSHALACSSTLSGPICHYRFTRGESPRGGETLAMWPVAASHPHR